MRDFITNDKLILYIIAAFLGFGGKVAGDLIDPPRPDPFTGTQGRELAKEIQQNAKHMERLQANQEMLLKWYYEARRSGVYFEHNHK